MGHAVHADELDVEVAVGLVFERRRMAALSIVFDMAAFAKHGLCSLEAGSSYGVLPPGGG